jgi:hypothetical protein
MEWFVEKTILQDMVQFVEMAHDGEFWDIWLRQGKPFEVLIYNMHIASRKLETVSSIFSKYQILESERELIRFGIGKHPCQTDARDP